jgi:hypothetical protein
VHLVGYFHRLNFSLSFSSNLFTFPIFFVTETHINNTWSNVFLCLMHCHETISVKHDFTASILIIWRIRCCPKNKQSTATRNITKTYTVCKRRLSISRCPQLHITLFGEITNIKKVIDHFTLKTARNNFEII